MRKKLRISNSLSLPLDTLTQRLAFFARTGAGKSYAAGVLAEDFLEAKQQIVVIDPQGAWWGLRSSADGKGPGYPILIMGGEHGDVPLEPTAGTVVADLVVNEGVSVILDLSGFETDAEEIRFVTAFIDRLFRKNRHPLMLLIDEADTFAPQFPMREENQMLHQMARLAKRGRSKGIGMAPISQRPAAISKRVVSQTEIMISLQTTDPRDKKAISDWTVGRGTDEEQKRVIATLPTLKVGEAWIWSPSFLRILKRVQIRTKRTFDSSATPKVGVRTRVAKVLAEVDIEKLKTQIAGTIEKAAQEDPKLLREANAKLRVDLRSAESRYKAAETRLEEERQKPAKVVPQPLPPEVKIQDRPTMSPAQEKRIRAGLNSIRKSADRLTQAVEDLTAKENKGISKTIEQVEVFLQTCRKTEMDIRIPVPRPKPEPEAPVRRPVHTVRTREGFRGHVAGRPETKLPDVKLRKGEKLMLESLIQSFPNRTTHARVGALSGYAYTGETYRTYFGVLKRHGLAEEEGDECWATELGSKMMTGVELLPQTTESMLEMWNKRLRLGERKLLDRIVAVYPKAITETDWMIATGIQNAETFRTYTGVLKRLQLASEVGRGKWKASESLFPEGR